MVKTNTTDIPTATNTTTTTNISTNTTTATNTTTTTNISANTTTATNTTTTTNISTNTTTTNITTINISTNTTTATAITTAKKHNNNKHSSNNKHNNNKIRNSKHSNNKPIVMVQSREVDRGIGGQRGDPVLAVGQGSGDSRSPVPQKLQFFTGDPMKMSWRGFISKFNRVASWRGWSDQKKLDRLFDCLNYKALEYANTE